MLLSNLEYGIRKRQHAIDRLQKDKSTAGLGSTDAKRCLILQHAMRLSSTKKSFSKEQVGAHLLVQSGHYKVR